MNFMSVVNLRSNYKQALIKKNYKEIYAHEMAHKNAAGSLAGNIVIEKNSEGIPVSGHVSIRMPKLNKDNPDETISQADIVIKSAMAPFDPSPQDLKVAAQAKSIKFQAEKMKTQKKLDFYA